MLIDGVVMPYSFTGRRSDLAIEGTTTRKLLIYTIHMVYIFNRLYQTLTRERESLFCVHVMIHVVVDRSVTVISGVSFIHTYMIA